MPPANISKTKVEGTENRKVTKRRGRGSILPVNRLTKKVEIAAQIAKDREYKTHISYAFEASAKRAITNLLSSEAINHAAFGP